MTKSGWVLAVLCWGCRCWRRLDRYTNGRMRRVGCIIPTFRRRLAWPSRMWSKTGNAPVSSIAMPKAAAAASKTQASGAEAESASAPAASEKDPKLCQQVRARKAFLQSNQLTKTVNDKGSVEFLSAEKRKAELAEVDKQIERFCP